MRILFTILFLLPCKIALTQTIYYVSAAAIGVNDGSSWANAFNNLQMALSTAQSSDQIWVKEGVYFPAPNNNRSASFFIKNGTMLYGGFSGIETTPSERDITAHPTILDGDIGQTGNYNDNCYHVLNAENCDSSTLIDGFSIRQGNADGSGQGEDKGGGILLFYSDPNIVKSLKVRNCIFSFNRGTYGGALALESSQDFIPSLQIEAANFTQNISKYDGGAIYTYGSVVQGEELYLLDCRFENNRAITGNGGGISFIHSSGSILIKSCHFERDSTRIGFVGGGLFLEVGEENSTLKIQNCHFSKCYAAEGGGLSILDPGSNEKTFNFQMDSTIFLENESNTPGGAMRIGTGSHTNMNVFWNNLIFQNNKNISDAPGVDFLNGGLGNLNILIKNTRFLNNRGGTLGAGGLRIANANIIHSQVKVLLENCLFYGNTGAYSITTTTKGASYTHIINSTFVNNSRYVFNKNWSPDFDYVNSYNFMDIYNCVIVDTTALKRIFYNNSFNPFTMNDYRVNHCLLSKPDCIFEGQSICGDQMLYDIDPAFEDNSFSPKPCSPLVNAGNNFWPDTFNITTDLLGVNRILFDTVDIGAYEVTQACISDASFQPKTEGSQLYTMLKNPVAEHEPLIFIADQAVYNEVSVQVFDFMGRLLQHKSYPKGANQVLSMSSDLLSGAYLAVIANGNKKYALRFVVAGQ